MRPTIKKEVQAPVAQAVLDIPKVSDEKEDGFIEKDIVVNCKAIQTLKGIMVENTIVKAGWFPGGQATVDNLLSKGLLKYGK